MDNFEFKKEQLKLAPKILVQDGFDKVKTIGGAECFTMGNNILACIVVCKADSFEVIETKIYLLTDPLSYHPEFVAYREMPALIEAYNLLETEPDVLFVYGSGILHPRKMGLADHLGLILNKPTIGITEKLPLGLVEQGKVFLGVEIRGFEVKTKEFANPIYISPGHLMSLGSALQLTAKTICYPHKVPEPLQLARKIGRKKMKELIGGGQEKAVGFDRESVKTVAA